MRPSPKFYICSRRWRRPVMLACLAAGSAIGSLPVTALATVVQPMVVEGSTGSGDRPADSPLPADLEATLRAQLEKIALGSSRGAVPGVERVEIEVGRLDPRLRLAPCERVEPYLPTGTRLWGKARIGLRCTQGSSPWNVYLPITVKVFGTAWVAAGTLAAGAVLSAGDLVRAEVDWAEDTSPTISEPEQAIGRSLVRRVTAGQGLRLADLKPRQWFAAGDTVKLVAVGRGFSISAAGQALNPGIEGQSVKVRTDAGRVVSGQATGDRRVEIRL